MKKWFLLCLPLLGFAGMSVGEKIDEVRQIVHNLELSAPEASEKPNQLALSFDVLYWHPKTDLTELGAVISSSLRPEGPTNAVGFDWDFGFKVGGGYQFTQQGCTLTIEYTRVSFSTEVLWQLQSSTKIIQPNFGRMFQNIEEIKASYNIGYQTATALLERELFVKGNLLFAYAYGVKASWINHLPKMISMKSNVDQHVDLTEKTVGLGPDTVLSTRWAFSKGWSIYGDMGMALLYTRYRGRMRTEGDNYTADSVEGKHYVVPNFALGLGLRYDRDLVESNNHLTASLGYESQYYVNQSYLMQSRDVWRDGVVPQGAWYARNLSVYGLVLRGNCQF